MMGNSVLSSSCFILFAVRNVLTYLAQTIIFDLACSSDNLSVGLNAKYFAHHQHRSDKLIYFSIISQRGKLYIENNRGHRTDPCETLYFLPFQCSTTNSAPSR